VIYDLGYALFYINGLQSSDISDFTDIQSLDLDCSFKIDDITTLEQFNDLKNIYYSYIDLPTIEKLKDQFPDCLFNHKSY
jgi:hypothetical protein